MGAGAPSGPDGRGMVWANTRADKAAAHCPVMMNHEGTKGTKEHNEGVGQIIFFFVAVFVASWLRGSNRLLVRSRWKGCEDPLVALAAPVGGGVVGDVGEVFDQVVGGDPPEAEVLDARRVDHGAAEVERVAAGGRGG